MKVIIVALFVTYAAGLYTGPAAASSCAKNYDVKSYGAVGDGITNDTVAVQAAINAAQAAGCGTVLGHATDTYLVYKSGTKNFGNTGVAYKYSLSIPSRVTLNLQSGTLRLADHQNSSIVVNANLYNGGDQNISIINANFDGNTLNQTDDPGLDTGAILMYGVTYLSIGNVTTNNVRTAGILVDNISNSSFDKVSCNTTYGDCFDFGLGNGWEVSNSMIGTISAQNCLGVSRGRVGNSFVATLINTTVNSITATNCAAGIKIQDTSNNVTVNQAYSYGGVNGTNNSGFKVEGNTDGNLIPQRVYVGYVYSQDQYGAGLYIQDATNTTVNVYKGNNNGTGARYPDVWVAGTNTTINNVTSQNAGLVGMTVRSDASNYTLGNVYIENAGQVQGAGLTVGMDVEGGNGTTNSLQVTSTQTPATQYGLNILAGARGSVQTLQAAGCGFNLTNRSSNFQTPSCCY